MTVRNTNDGTQREPRLRLDINGFTFAQLPPFSTGPRGEDKEAKLRAVKEAGFEGVQGSDIPLCKKLGLRFTGGGRVNAVGEVGPMARQWKDEGCDCATLHVAWGLEPDDEVDRLVDDVLNTSTKLDFPLYIETHRATITGDMFRTVRLVERHPDVRLNGDFSHWYTGQEMVYGDFERKLDFLAPVFERVRFVHGRIGNPGCMQVDIGTETVGGKQRPYVDHFREMWTRSFAGFLRTARPGDYLCFTPELIPHTIYYARAFPNAQGELVEEGDRWQQGLLYARIAQECFDEARRRVAGGHA